MNGSGEFQLVDFENTMSSLVNNRGTSGNESCKTESCKTETECCETWPCKRLKLRLVRTGFSRLVIFSRVRLQLKDEK